MVAPTTLEMSEASLHISKKQTLEKEFQNRVNAPKTALDWAIVLSNTLNEIGRDYFTLLLKKSIMHEDLIHFIKKLAFITHKRQERLKEQLVRENDYQHECEQARILQSWANTQLKTVSVEEAPESTKSLFKEIMDLLLKLSKLSTLFTNLSTSQQTLKTKWNKWHHAKANHIINQLNGLMHLSDQQKEALRQILAPASPSMMFKLNPYLAKKVLEVQEELQNKQSPSLVNPICINMTRINDVMGELSAYALLDDQLKEGERLMGPALLAAMRNKKELFKQANISFAADNHIGQAAAILEGARLFKQGNEARYQLDQASKDLKCKMQQIKKDIDQLENTPSSNRNRYKLPDAFDPYAGPLRTRPREP